MSVPNASHEPDPYETLLTNIKRHLKEKKLGDKILDLVKLSCEEALRDERIILSRAEQTRFVQLVTKDILLEILAHL